MDNDHFKRVLRKAKAGDEKAFVELYQEFHPPLLRFLMARSFHDGEDIASEVWMTVAKGLGSFQGDEGGFRAWVFTTARRRLIDLARRRASRPPQTELPDTEFMAFDTVTDQLEMQEAIEELTKGLSEEQSEVLLLKVLGGFDAKEIAAITGRTEGSVRTMQHRILKALAQKFGDGR